LSNSLRFAFFHTQLLRELDTAPVSWDAFSKADVKQLPVLARTIDETMRMKPATAGVFGRVSKQPTVIGGEVLVPSGIEVMIAVVR
jgi:cytochrome P450